MSDGGFSNAVVGGVGTLVRAFMRSVDYVAGVAGWAIFRNGDAEFNNATVRGELQVGSAAGPGILIEPSVPAVLVTFYTGAGFTLADVSTIEINDNGDYVYRVTGEDVTGRVFHAEGMVYAGTGVVEEILRIGAKNPTTTHTTFSLLNRPETQPIQAVVGEGGGLAWATTATAYWVWNFPVVAHFKGVDLVYDQLSLGRGVVDAVDVTTIGALTVASAAETDIPNLALTFNFTAGRRYVISARVALNTSVATDLWGLRARLDTPVTGTRVGEAFGSTGSSETPEIRFVYTPAVSGSHTIFFSHLRIAGTGTITAFGAPAAGISRTWAMGEDKGGTGNGSVNQWRTA